MNSSTEIMDGFELLNDLNRAIATKQHTLDTVITASSLLLVSALRQLGPHGLERARLIGAGLERMVENERQAYEELGGLRG